MNASFPSESSRQVPTSQGALQGASADSLRSNFRLPRIGDRTEGDPGDGGVVESAKPAVVPAKPDAAAGNAEFCRICGPIAPGGWIQSTADIPRGLWIPSVYPDQSRRKGAILLPMVWRWISIPPLSPGSPIGPFRRSGRSWGIKTCPITSIG